MLDEKKYIFKLAVQASLDGYVNVDSKWYGKQYLIDWIRVPNRMKDLVNTLAHSFYNRRKN